MFFWGCHDHGRPVRRRSGHDRVWMVENMCWNTGCKKRFWTLPAVLFLLAVAYSGILLCGCLTEKKQQQAKENDTAIKCGMITISLSDFTQELELKKTAYPWSIEHDINAYNALVIDLVKQLSEEVLLMREAAEKGISVTPLEMENAEKTLRNPISEEDFRNMLWESGVTYAFWKKRLAGKLLRERVIEQELKKKLVITPTEMTAFYQKTHESDTDKNNDTDDNRITEAELLKAFRAEKTQKKYTEWIIQLAKTYPVEIDKNILKHFFKFEKTSENIYKNGIEQGTEKGATRE